jgi:hypothetical protein
LRESLRLDGAHEAALRDSVQRFAATVAQGITARGPVAWQDYFTTDSAFFMASEGHLVFPNRTAATQAINNLTHTVAHIELRWGDSLRVDPLAAGLAVMAAPYHETQIDNKGHHVEEDGFFTGVAEHRSTGWQFRNAHWSVVVPPSPVP